MARGRLGAALLRRQGQIDAYKDLTGLRLKDTSEGADMPDQDDQPEITAATPHGPDGYLDPAHTTVARIVTGAERRPDKAFAPDFYPCLYARDFLRDHGAAFGLSGKDWARADPGTTHPTRPGARVLMREMAERTGQSQDETLIALADGYLIENGHQVPAERKQAALERSRELNWKSHGLPCRPSSGDLSPPGVTLRTGTSDPDRTTRR